MEKTDYVYVVDDDSDYIGGGLFAKSPSNHSGKLLFALTI
jgi:hypothetical protein